jgi:hypothetical protein
LRSFSVKRIDEGEMLDEGIFFYCGERT